MNPLKAILQRWKIQERPNIRHWSAESQPEKPIFASTNAQLASIAEALINRFRESYSTDPKVRIRSFVATDIARIEDLADRSRLEAWVDSASSVNLFEYAVAPATPFDSPPHVRDTILIGMDRIFCDRAEDLPREATGAMTIGESLQDVWNFLASKLDG
jgi:hypothetical protein